MPYNGSADQRRIRLKGLIEGTPVGARGQKPPASSFKRQKPRAAEVDLNSSGFVRLQRLVIQHILYGLLPGANLLEAPINRVHLLANVVESDACRRVL